MILDDKILQNHLIVIVCFVDSITRMTKRRYENLNTRICRSFISKVIQLKKLKRLDKSNQLDRKLLINQIMSTKERIYS